MNLFVEGSPLISQQKGYLKHRTGVGNYTYHLLKNLIYAKSNFDITIVGFRTLKDKYHRPSKKQLALPRLRHKFVHFIPREIYTRLMRFHLAPPIDLLVGDHPDVWLFPNFVRFPLYKKTKSIVIVYDLSFLKFPEYAKRVGPYLRSSVPRSLRKASHIITISNNSKQEIIQAYSIRSDKISVVSPAIDHARFKPQGKSKVTLVMRKHKITQKYILYTGTIEPRKNVTALLKAYESLPEEIRSKYALVLAGTKGWLNDEFDNYLQKLEKLNIQLLGYVEDDDLPSLYAGASVFVYPSHYEGFGMPPLEAMACGTPVIAANNSSLPEVVGKAGILIDAKRTDEISGAIRTVLSDHKLRQRMHSQSLKQAAKFSWQASGKTLVDILSKLDSSIK